MSTFLNAFFTNSQRPVVDCLTVAAGILARSEGVIKGTGADQRFCKTTLFKKCGVSPFILINISSLVLSDSYMQHHYNQIILAISPHGCYS